MTVTQLHAPITAPDPVTLLVETTDLRRALRACAAFLLKNDDPTSPWSRVRVLASRAVTYVTARNGSSGACALVSTIALARAGESLNEVFAFDLSAADVSKILTCVPGRDGKDGEPGDELELTVDAEHLTVVDASGLFEGQSLVLGRMPDLERPSAIIRSFIHLGAFASPAPTRNGALFTEGTALALLVAASKVYGKLAILETHPRGSDGKATILARIGESFIAILTPPYVDDETGDALDGWRDSWTERLSNLDTLLAGDPTEEADQ